jgi:hypothetical protein
LGNNFKNDHSTNQNKLEIKDKNKAFQALKLLPNDKNAKKQFSFIVLKLLFSIFIIG